MTAFFGPLTPAPGQSPEQFFEEKVRPVLAAKCQACHNDGAKMAGLSLASREAAMLGGGRGSAVIPGQPEESLLVQAIRREGALKMPPTGPLEASEIEALTAWVRDGAAWPDAADAAPPATSSHWSFQPIERPESPQVKNEEWSRNAIDRFVLARLEKEGFEPSAEADRRTLIRRLSLDLIGLPPSPEEVAEFLNDERSDAYERLVDRLLASEHYGERWGRHWLDIARYADSNGYSIDSRRSMWRYRDWVIEKLNQDKPFDRFVIEQFAGDLLPNPTQDQLIATGFHRNTMVNEEGGIDFEQYRVEAVVDRVSTTGAAFLGLTVGCARCHDHKFDPISQREFYGLYSFFNNVDELSGEFSNEEGRKRMLEPKLEFGDPEDFEQRSALRLQQRILEEELTAYEKGLDAKQTEWEGRLTEAELAEMPDHIREIVQLDASERTSLRARALQRYFRSKNPGWQARQAGLKALRKQEPKIDYTLVMEELPEPRDAFVHTAGDFTRRGDEVTPKTPSVLRELYTPEDDLRPTRLDLARWLVSEENPLTARVTVNRVWQRYFGLGIVETENDFGSQGTPPSHPELLDWLASEFMANDWSLKALHRTIVTSATYRQASKVRPEIQEKDPQNRLLARQNRVRLEAEIIRDAALAASGLLTPTVGGPSVYPPQPDGMGKFTQVDRKWTADEGPNRFRRGMYTFFWRSAAHPSLTLFDAPNAQATTTRRNRSNTPLQSLTLLNDRAQVEFAEGLAKRVMEQGGKTKESRIDYAFEVSLARLPKPEERQRFAAYLARMEDDFQSESDLPIGADAETAAWVAGARVLMNLDEFVTRP